jgi:hypothetical protein
LQHPGWAGTHFRVSAIPLARIRLLRRGQQQFGRLCLPTRSMRFGLSAGARELLTRLNTGQRCSTSSAAGLSKVEPPLLSQDAKSFDSRTTSMRSCTSATKSFGSVMSIVQDFSTSPVARDQLFWQRYTSFWVSSLLNRIVFFVIQFVAALIPLGWLYIVFLQMVTHTSCWPEGRSNGPRFDDVSLRVKVPSSADDPGSEAASGCTLGAASLIRRTA